MKLRKVFSLVINLAAIIFSMVGFILVGKDLTPIAFVKYFTLVTNTLIIICSLISCGYIVDGFIKKENDKPIHGFFYVMKLITSVGALITFLTVVCYLQHTVYRDPSVTVAGHANNIMHHYLAPLSFILGFIFFDNEKKYDWRLAFFGITVLVIYMAYAIPFSNIASCKSWWGDAPYVFMDYNVVKVWVFALVPGFILVGIGFSFLLWFLNRIMYLIFVGDEIKQDEPETKEEKALEAKVQVTEADEAAIAEVLKQPRSGSRIYHISRREDKMWQVKFANGQRAIKLFNTQAEAIVFAKKLAKSQLGSIRVHSVQGRIRKAH
ncbi:MAG: DUF2188 domain-containing protein [Bacilli bacterium]|nr:DUF2188 domain-containing protein [Bacilli bacterium]